MAETMNFEAAAYTAQGNERGERLALPASTFDGTVNLPVMHQAVKAFLANQRQATSKTKTRSFVTGGNQKPWKQKGTGRARQGSTRAPHWVGGGTVFGPDGQHNYHEDVPRQIRQLAKKSALNARARENAIFVIDRLDYEAPKTARMAALVNALGLDGRKVLVLTDGAKGNVHLSARNLPTVHVMPFTDASTYHILWSDVLLVESAAIGQALEPVAGEAPAPARTPARRAPAETAARAEKAERKTAAKAAKKAAKTATKKKTAAKKSATKKTATKSAAKPAAKKSAKPAAKKSAAKKSASKRAKE
jgi:large subunit ribosomal protein L4